MARNFGLPSTGVDSSHPRSEPIHGSNSTAPLDVRELAARCFFFGVLAAISLLFCAACFVYSTLVHEPVEYQVGSNADR